LDKKISTLLNNLNLTDAILNNLSSASIETTFFAIVDKNKVVSL